MDKRKDSAQLRVIDTCRTVDVPPMVLVTQTENLQSSVFVKRISEEFSTFCTTVDLAKALEADAGCLLLDASQLSAGEVEHLLINNRKLASSRQFVLLNVTQQLNFEFVLNWPEVRGIFSCNCSHVQLRRGLNAIFAGDYWFPRSLLHRFLERNRRSPRYRDGSQTLTQREQQILLLIRDCYTNADIAGCLFVSEHTVKSHLYKIYRKIGCKNRLEASTWAQENLDA